MKEYYKMDKLLDDINDLITDTFVEYDTNRLNNIIVELVQRHIFTSKDSINNLIIELENYKEQL